MAQTKARHMATQVKVERHRRWPLILGVALVIALAGGAAGWMLLRGGADEDEVIVQEAASQATADESAQQKKGQDVDKTAKDKNETPNDDDLAAQFAAGKINSVRLVGDSITAGFGTDGYVDANYTQTGNVIYDNGAGLVRYETPADAQCWANAFREYATEHGVSEFLNAGINGAFMKELAENPDAWLGEGADVVFVALGTNDAGYETAEEYETAARTALEAAEQKSKILVVVSPVRDLRPQSWLMASPKELGDILRTICEERGYLFVDTFDAVAPEQFCDDGLHPATSGSLAIWDRIRTTLEL